ncbi:MAG: hypothetical protein PHY02_09730 [Phycisphaerae bacterium]|nr:hypothetical protein [Phycisphaerae bacterium]
MYELRRLKPEDIAEIRGSLIERRELPDMAVVNKIMSENPAYTYLMDDKVVACCGAIKIDGDWQIWAMYSKNFSCFTRCRAAMAFKRHLPEIGKAKIYIPSDLPNGKKYAEFLGATYIRSEMSKIWAGINNDIYEVA